VLWNVKIDISSCFYWNCLSYTALALPSPKCYNHRSIDMLKIIFSIWVDNLHNCTINKLQGFITGIYTDIYTYLVALTIHAMLPADFFFTRLIIQDKIYSLHFPYTFLGLGYKCIPVYTNMYVAYLMIYYFQLLLPPLSKTLLWPTTRLWRNRAQGSRIL